ncbi:hypothetical protein K3495_g5631 [Podosphaera aphanis]|nr:hypothetical protein K3495_g5631 [Podosphaera aphanis]
MSFHTQFRWLYVGFYGFLHFILAVLLLVTPADAIRQALDNKQIYNVFVIAGGYFLTLMLALILYTTRLYTDSSILKAIPKTWIPIERGDVSQKVRHMVLASLNRSALIAWYARPRVPQASTAVNPNSQNTNSMFNPAENRQTGVDRNSRLSIHEKTKSQSFQSVWDEISHTGWSSPLSPDLPNLQYMTVVLELPHIIEAKAISLAPLDMDSSSNPKMPDTRAVDILQRSAAMDFRNYVSYLTSLGVISSSHVVIEFLSLYEHARFSGQSLSEQEFRDLMKQFAEILRDMNALDARLLEINDLRQSESDIDDDENSAATPETSRSHSLVPMHFASDHSESEGTILEAWPRYFNDN